MTKISSRSGSCARSVCNGLIAALVALAAQTAVAAAPAVGDTYVYRIINGYNNETRGQLTYRVDQADAGRIVMAITTDQSADELAIKEIYTPDGKWLRHPMLSHDRVVDYEYTPAFPSYDFPLETGKKWSNRVDAVIPESGAKRSVRVDATVNGTEHIRVPAGEFDTIKISRSIYAGDAGFPLSETNIRQTEWYAPSLGRAVRVNISSGWNDISVGIRNSATRGDWNVFELVSATPAR